MTMSSIIITGTIHLSKSEAPADCLDVVSKREVAKWRAYVNVSMTLGRSVGGPVGGVLTDTIGWRWYVNSMSFHRMHSTNHFVELGHSFFRSLFSASLQSSSSCS